jgi:hypothetical protein
MLDRILAPIAILGLAFALGVIIWRVPDPALIVVVSVTILFCVVDFWRVLRSKSRGR